MMALELVITPRQGGWQVRDADERLPVSHYRAIEDAREEARQYLLNRGGGRIVVRETGNVITTIDVTVG